MRDAVGGDVLVGELLCAQLAQAGDHPVAERTGGERRVRLDQGHGDARIDLAEGAGAAGAGEAAADDHHARGGALREAPEAGSTAAEAVAATPSSRNRRRVIFMSRRHHFCAANQAASAWISSSVKPLAIRSMTVPSALPRAEVLHRAHDRGAIAARRAAGTGDVTVADAG